MPLRLAALGATVLLHALSSPGSAESENAADLGACLDRQPLPRVVRYLGEGVTPQWGLVVEHQKGEPRSIAALAPMGTPLVDVFRRAAERAGTQETAAIAEAIPAEKLGDSLCSAADLWQEQIDDRSRIVVAAGLNYAAHAEEAGGGEVFMFPKATAPTGAYQGVAAPAGVSLLDYEVELAALVIDPLDLEALPDDEALEERIAFVLSNDISDREPIIRKKAFSGPGTGFVTAKSQPSFLPLGPWLIQGSELRKALTACQAETLGLQLAVDEGAGPNQRQSANTRQMILDLRALLERIATQVSSSGVESPMKIQRGERMRTYPLAQLGPEDEVRLPAGSVVLTGTPEGVSLQAPAVFPLLLRAAIRLRGPFDQFAIEEIDRAALAEPGGYLAAGDVVHAMIDGLGAQRFTIAPAGSPPPRDPCRTPPSAP